MVATKRAIRTALKSGDFVLTLHTIERMDERSVLKEDIVSCGKTMKSCRYQPEQGTFLVRGSDLDRRPLSVVCAIEDGLIVVTIF